MNTAEELKQKIYGEVCPTNTVYAGIYARVSTTNLGQKESCDNQVAYAMDYIAQHPNIRLRSVFVDDGISGKNDENRPEYQKMLKMIHDGEIDVIIIKDYSRANRSTNAFELEEILIENGATFINLATGRIDDLEDPDATFARRIQYLVDAKYVEDQSRKARMTQQLRCQNKILSEKDTSFGYKWNSKTKTISINEEEAEIVKWIFNEYVFRNATPASIYRSLKAKGINICERTVNNYIKDERYIGNFYINKWTTKLGMGRAKSKKRLLPKSEWVLVERPDLQIVNTAIFDLAQRIHEARISYNAIPSKGELQARFQGRHKFSNKIFCADCGKAFHHDFADVHQTKHVYRIKSHSNCKNKNRCISEQDIEGITRQALKTTIEDQDKAFANVEHALSILVKASQSNISEIQNLKKKRAGYEKKKANLVNFISEGGLTEQDKTSIREDLHIIINNITNLNQLIQDSEQNILDDSYIDEKLNSIRNAISELKNFTVIDRNRIINYIDRIELSSDDSIEICFKYGQLFIHNYVNKQIVSETYDSGKMGKTYDRYSLPGAYRRTHRL